MSSAGGRVEHVQSLSRGLAVLQAFSRDRAEMTLAEVARATGLTRATARRLLLTLVALDYVRSDGGRFRLTPHVLDLGYAYLSSLDLERVAEPEMERLVERTHESCSAAVLDGTEVVYVVRVPTRRIMTIALALGSRLPAHATSLGRALLAELDDDALDGVLARVELRSYTPHTIVDRDRLRAEIRRVRRQGWALVDQELEVGLRSVAAPIRGRTGVAVAAVNVSAAAGRVSLERMRGEFVPALLATVERINHRLAGSWC